MGRRRWRRCTPGPASSTRSPTPPSPPPSSASLPARPAAGSESTRPAGPARRVDRVGHPSRPFGSRGPDGDSDRRRLGRSDACVAAALRVGAAPMPPRHRCRALRAGRLCACWDRAAAEPATRAMRWRARVPEQRQTDPARRDQAQPAGCVPATQPRLYHPWPALLTSSPNAVPASAGGPRRSTVRGRRRRCGVLYGLDGSGGAWDAGEGAAHAASLRRRPAGCHRPSGPTRSSRQPAQRPTAVPQQQGSGRA